MRSPFGRTWLAALVLCAAFPSTGFALNIQGPITVDTGPTAAGPWTVLAPTSPTTTIFVGQYVRISMVLENDTGRLGKLNVIDTSDPYPVVFSGGQLNLAVATKVNIDPFDWCTENDQPTQWPGQYWVWPVLGSGCGTMCTAAGACPNGSAYLSPQNEYAPLRFVSADPITTWDYNNYTYAPGAPSQTVAVQWVFRAEMKWKGVDFTVFAANEDDAGDYDEPTCGAPGSGPCTYGGGDCTCNDDPIGCPGVAVRAYEGTFVDCDQAGCPAQSNPLPSLGTVPLDTILQTYWAGGGSWLNIASPLDISAAVRQVNPGTRPPGVLYIDDVIELNVSVTNTGSITATVTGRSAPVITPGPVPGITVISKAAQVGPCVTTVDHYWPSGTVLVGAGAQQSFTWSFTVVGAGQCSGFGLGEIGSPGSGSLYFDPVDMGGAVTRSATLYFEPAPLAISVTTWLDPDGGGPEPSYPLPLIGPGLAGTLYYMSDDTLEVRATFANTSNLYSYEINPAAVLGGAAGSSYQLVSGPTPLPIMLDPMPAPTSATVLVYSYAMNPASVLAKSCIADPGSMDFSVMARGQCGSAAVKVSDHPFKGSANLFHSVTGLSAASVEKDKEFYVDLGVKNPLSRRMRMSSRADRGLALSKPAGDSTTWVITGLPVPFQQTWNPAETKLFQWKLKATNTGTLYACAGVSYGASGLCSQNEAVCQTACCSGGGCPCTESSKIEVTEPQFLKIVSFTATPMSVYDDARDCHKVLLEIEMRNASMAETLFVDSIKNPCDADTGSGVLVDAGPSPAAPLELPPQVSATVQWQVCAVSGTDRRFGTYAPPACAPLLHASVLGCATEIHVANAVTDPLTLLIADLEIACEAVPASPVAGQDFEVRLTVENKGGIGAVSVSPQLLVKSGVSLLSSLGGPASSPPVSLGAGSSQVFKWDYRALTEGQVGFTASISGTEAGSGRALSVTKSVAVTIQPGAAGPLKGISPGGFRTIGGGTNKVGVNPRQGVKIQVWSDAAGTVTATLKIYDQSLSLVREWTSDIVAGRPDLVIWDGRDDRGKLVTPGVYYLMVTGEGIAKTKLGDIVIPVGR